MRRAPAREAAATIEPAKTCETAPESSSFWALLSLSAPVLSEGDDDGVELDEDDEDDEVEDELEDSDEEELD